MGLDHRRNLRRENLRKSGLERLQIVRWPSGGKWWFRNQGFNWRQVFMTREQQQGEHPYTGQGRCAGFGDCGNNDLAIGRVVGLAMPETAARTMIADESMMEPPPPPPQ
jgi:hypothetical protein